MSAQEPKVVKIIHVIKRLEALDRDLMELRDMKNRLSNDRAYFPDMSIAFDRQINKLLNERIKLMELKILDPPENLKNNEWKTRESFALPDDRDLKSPAGEGPVLSQGQADSLVAQFRSSQGKKKTATLVLGDSDPKISENSSPSVPEKPAIVRETQSRPDDNLDEIKTFKI